MRIINLSHLTALCLFAAAAVSVAGTSVSFELNVKKAEADSLQEKADSLEDEASKLQDKLNDIEDDQDDREDLENDIDDLKDKLSDLKDQIKDAQGDLKDANYDVEKSKQDALDDIKESRKDALDDINEEASEHPKTGSFILAFEYSQLDTDPLKDLLKNDKSLQAARGQMDFSNNGMMMFGLMGYYNLESNIRVGNSIHAGYRPFTSNVLFDTLSTGRIDSNIISLNAIPVYVGFICEKALVFNPVNFFAGIMLGGNMSIVVKEEKSAEQASLFVDADEEDSDNAGEYSAAFAPALAWDVHGGMAVRLAPKLHLGVDGVLRFAYAYGGYGAGFGDFISINPGVRLRLTFGSAG